MTSQQQDVETLFEQGNVTTRNVQQMIKKYPLAEIIFFADEYRRSDILQHVLNQVLHSPPHIERQISEDAAAFITPILSSKHIPLSLQWGMLEYCVSKGLLTGSVFAYILENCTSAALPFLRHLLEKNIVNVNRVFDDRHRGFVQLCVCNDLVSLLPFYLIQKGSWKARNDEGDTPFLAALRCPLYITTTILLWFIQEAKIDLYKEVDLAGKNAFEVMLDKFDIYNASTQAIVRKHILFLLSLVPPSISSLPIRTVVQILYAFKQEQSILSLLHVQKLLEKQILITKDGVLYRNARYLRVLSGPSLFAYYKNIIGKRILMLGEYHSKSAFCPSEETDAYAVHEWLYDISRQAPRCIDIIVEQDYSMKQGQSFRRTFFDQSSLTDVFQSFRGQKKNLPNLRYHYIDTRTMGHTMEPIAKAADRFRSARRQKRFESQYIRVFSEMKQYISDCRLLFEFVLGIDRSGRAKTLFETLIQKFSIGVKDVEEQTSNITKFYTKFWALMDKECNKLTIPREIITNFLVSFATRECQKHSKEENIFILLLALPMDFYTLVRLFIQFDKEKMGRKCSDAPTMQHIIIYAGSRHIRNYMQFFDETFHKKPNIFVDANKNQCIHLPKPFDFFNSGQHTQS